MRKQAPRDHIRVGGKRSSPPPPHPSSSNPTPPPQTHMCIHIFLPIYLSAGNSSAEYFRCIQFCYVCIVNEFANVMLMGNRHFPDITVRCCGRVVARFSDTTSYGQPVTITIHSQ
eukprot:GHVL01024659.1.p1 GENE.GHVL01024659.1~~GHVL01024659.1.p1  ORF type:complete len:115 (+),score=7.18 GHVL01024659.1:97-441(+)